VIQYPPRFSELSSLRELLALRESPANRREKSSLGEYT